MIGALRTARLFHEACDRFPDGKPPVDCASRRKLMLETVSPNSDEFNHLDEQFYKYEDDIGVLLEKFKSNNER